MQVRPLRAWVLALVLLTACGTPPHKEIDQAQGAIDAARAAGADRLATEEFNAATTSLKLANDAVDQRDYRLALNHALESREHLRCACAADAWNAPQIRGAESGQAVQPAAPAEHDVRQLQDILRS